MAVGRSGEYPDIDFPAAGLYLNPPLELTEAFLIVRWP